MRTFALSFLGGLAALFIFFIVLPLMLISAVAGANSGPTPPRGPVVLALDLRLLGPDQPATDGFSALFSSDSFIELLLKLDAAAEDDKVKGVFVRASEMDLGSSRAEELRAAFLKLREAGKFVVAHSQGFYASGPAAYRAVAAADEIWMQPGAPFETPGIVFETLFFKDAFDRFGVTAEIEQMFEFKNAADVYKQSGYTEPFALAMTALGESVWSESIADIAADRSRIAPELTPETVRARLENSPHSAEEALELKLIDGVGWPEDVEEATLTRDGEAELMAISDYAPAHRSGKGVIALVGGEGAIVTGDGGTTDLLGLGEAAFASDRVTRDLLGLVEDDSVDAVVFRVDSPGGSPTASEQVWRAVERLKAAGKPVVVSMGSVAASGGYYVAAGADAIVANRSTITGSIGVYGGKFAFADALRKFGVNADEVRIGGEYASIYSTETLTQTQRAKLISTLDDVYQRFTQLVSDGRKLPLEQVRDVAKGRVWSGADAAEIGLVDETGGLIAAIAKAKALAGYAPEDRVEVRMNIHEASPFELLQGFMSSAGVKARAAATSRETLAALIPDRRLREALNQARMLTQEPVQLAIPPLYER